MHIRTAEPSDLQKIKELYLRVSTSGDGIARKPHEVTDDYINNFVTKSLQTGLIIVADHPTDHTQIIGEIHGYSPGINVFKHVISDLTIAVDPEFQGKKIGRSHWVFKLKDGWKCELKQTRIPTKRIFRWDGKIQTLNLNRKMTIKFST